MREQRFVGVHLGTSNVRVTVYDFEGSVLHSGEAPITEQTTVAWERALREATPPVPDDAICSVTSTSGTAVLVDNYGEPVFPPEMYYESAPEQAERLRQVERDERSPNWDSILSPTGPLAKILRLREENPDQFEDVEWILSPTTWLLYRLHYGSSERWHDIETDWTNAMKFGADVTTPVPVWFDTLFESVDLSSSLFPTIRPPGTYIGVGKSELADRMNFDDIKLFQGITDGSAFVLANGCLEPGDFSLTFGATSVIKYVSESITPHDALYYHRHPLEGYLPSVSFESGNSLRWFFNRILDCSEEQGLELANSVPAGEEYEVFLPGNRGPSIDSLSGSSILGIQYDKDIPTDEIHGRLARGLTAGIVLTESTYITLIEEHFDTTIDRVQVLNDDAPTHQENYRWWNKFRASVWDRPVREMEPRTTAGPIIPAALVTGVYSGVDEAMEKLLRPRSSVEPDPELTRKYQSKRESYLERWQTIAQVTEGE